MQLLARIKAAFTSERWLQSSMRVLTGGSDSARQPFSYSQAVLYYRSWIYAAANLNAMAVASQPLRLYVRNRSTGTKLWKTRSASHRTKAYFAGDTSELPSRYVMQKAAEYGDDYEVVTDNHPLLELLSKVNPYQNGFDATVLRVLYQELTGNAYIHPVIDKRTGIPSELWTMPSQYVEIIPGKSTLVDGYLYGASRENRKVFASDEVIHFKRPNPSDILYGMGKVEAAWGAAMMNAAMHEMDLSFFENKARPDYLMTIKTNASREEIERLEVQIDEKLRGKGRTGRFLTATADIDLKPMNFPPKDLGGREDIVEEIAAIFGVPVSMLKANDPNLASATVGFQSWKAISVLPLMRMDEETLNQNLVPLFGIEGDAFLAYDSPVVEDERFAFERRRSSVSAGVMTANEMRSREGLDLIDDAMADRLLINGQPLGGVGSPVALPSLAPAQDVKPAAQAPQAVATAPESAAPAPVALESAQVAALVDMVEQVKAGALPLESAREIARVAFPIVSPASIDAIFAPLVDAEITQQKKMLMQKDCGTGSGGFQSGNTCGSEDGESVPAGRLKSDKLVSSYNVGTEGREVPVYEAEGYTIGEVLNDPEREKGMVTTFSEIKNLQESNGIVSDRAKSEINLYINGVPISDDNPEVILSLASSRLEKGIRLMRGVYLDKGQIDTIIKSGVVSHATINSWTASTGVAGNFGGDVATFVLRNPAVGWINKQDINREEEIIRPPSSLSIVAVTKTQSGSVIIEVEEDKDYAR